MTVTPTLFQTDLFRPAYRPWRGDRWEILLAPMALCKGYWSDTMLVTDMAGLIRHDDDKPRTWMSITPMEIESQEIGCRSATGHTLVMGMGMGWAVANTALRPEVTRVTVVEFDAEVIAVNAAMDVLGQLPPDAAAKVTVIQGDALSYVPDEPVDLLMPDIWQPLYDDGRLEQVRRMWANTGAARVYYWGQELDIAQRARRLGLPLDGPTVARIVEETGLPLVGPAEIPNYPDLIERAARNWLRTDWTPPAYAAD